MFLYRAVILLNCQTAVPPLGFREEGSHWSFCHTRMDMPGLVGKVLCPMPSPWTGLNSVPTSRAGATPVCLIFSFLLSFFLFLVCYLGQINALISSAFSSYSLPIWAHWIFSMSFEFHSALINKSVMFPWVLQCKICSMRQIIIHKKT